MTAITNNTLNINKLPYPLTFFNKMDYKYPLKYKHENDIVSIIGIPTMEECRIFSQGGKPVLISKLAAIHYNVSSLNELIDKTALVFRRVKDDNGNYEEPWRWHTYKVIIKSFKDLQRLDSAYVTVENANNSIEDINIQRICIDWNYKHCN